MADDVREARIRAAICGFESGVADGDEWRGAYGGWSPAARELLREVCAAATRSLELERRIEALADTYMRLAKGTSIDMVACCYWGAVKSLRALLEDGNG